MSAPRTFIANLKILVQSESKEDCEAQGKTVMLDYKNRGYMVYGSLVHDVNGWQYEIYVYTGDV